MMAPLRRIVLTLLLVFLVGFGSIRGQSGEPLVHANGLTYQGAFRVPAGLDYGGTAITYNAAHNSLYIVGPGGQAIGEVSIPGVNRGADVSALSTASMLQSLKDPTNGKVAALSSSGSQVNIGGLLLFGGKLLISAYIYYDATYSQTATHFVSDPNLSTPNVRGPYQIEGGQPGFVSGYMGLVPSDWQASLGGPVVIGNCCIPIITRTSYGPALFSINPADFGNRNPVPATPLVYYTGDHPTLGDYHANTRLFNGSATMTGVVFPQGTRSVLFFGSIGTGPFCYGTGSECNDPVNPYQGTHGYPYIYQVWAYDALDLVAVKQGQKQPWDIKPYSTWTLDLPYADGRGRMYGAAYDPTSARIFVSQGTGDGALPVIHVYKVDGSTTTNAPPAPPRNVRIVG